MTVARVTSGTQWTARNEIAASEEEQRLMAKVVYAVKNCSVAKSQFEGPVESEQYLHIYPTVVEDNPGTLYRSSHRNSFGIDPYGCTYSTRP